MSTLMLVSNPRQKKGSKKMATRKHRTAAQKAATRKLVALNKARRSSSGATSHAAPARRRRHTSLKTHATRTYRRARSAAGRTIRRARRHHSASHRAGFGIVHLLKQAGLGAVGALAVDIVYNKLPIPANFKSGNMAPIVKGAVTIGLGMLAGKVMNRNTAHGATVGALTVQLHEVLKNVAAGAGLAGYTDINGIEYYSPAPIADSGTGMYLSDAGASDMGEYVHGMDYATQYEHVF